MDTKDLALLKEKGISEAMLLQQLESFKNGFPYLKISKAAEINDGIVAVGATDKVAFIEQWKEYLSKNKQIVKFVPASGAASRMFKDLFEFLCASYNEPTTAFEKNFFQNIPHFAFYNDLNDICLKNNQKDINQLLSEKAYKTVVKNLLDKEGLNYGNLPKGLLKFHSYPDGSRTPLEEHLVEGALYTNSQNKVSIHFTVSNEHRELFSQHVNEVIDKYSKLFGVTYTISFSEQKTSTDTIAADSNNEPFRENGQLVFRPGGHGALIQNLNDIDADIVFIKNIDNVVPDHLKADTVEYKELIAGILVNLQTQAFTYLQALENATILHEKLLEIADFCSKKLMNTNENIAQMSDNELRNYLIGKLNRPIRVCGMVKNEGEPGGGPYLVINNDGSISPQILESSQINTNDPQEKAIMMSASHFNPVDLVCSLKDYKGNQYDLLRYVDKNTGFISSKSKNGKELKALELPGLWNGAMSDWNTIFVEVPVSTFNPVKTVNDLLRKEHQ
jgi:hypothetical protein